MPKRSPNALIRQRYQQARSVVRGEEQRELTQQEFLDVAFGNNPRTGKPYNPRTLRKWLKDERKADAAVAHSERDTYSFQQYVQIGDDVYAPTLTKPSGASGLDLFTPSGRKRVKRAARERLQERIEQTQNLPNEVQRVHKDKTTGETTIETYRPVRSTRGMKTRKARAVSNKRAGVIITRKQRKPMEYINQQAA